jgi:hypothetical protein
MTRGNDTVIVRIVDGLIIEPSDYWNSLTFDRRVKI